MSPFMIERNFAEQVDFIAAGVGEVNQINREVPRRVDVPADLIIEVTPQRPEAILAAAAALTTPGGRTARRGCVSTDFPSAKPWRLQRGTGSWLGRTDLP